MALLTLNGVTMPVALDGLTRSAPELIGEEGRAFSGADLSTVRARKDGWRATFTPQTAAAAAAFRALVLGLGYVWSYDSDLYADRKGLGPSSSTGCSVVASGKYGSRLRVTAGNRIEYSIAGSATAWTLMYWKRTLDFYALGTGPVWEHFIRVGTGVSYKDGAATAHTTPNTWSSYDGSTLTLYSPAHANVYTDYQVGHVYGVGDLIRGGSAANIFFATNGGTAPGEPDFDTAPSLEDTVDDGVITWSNYGAGLGYVDDVLFLPAAVPSTWVAQLYAEASARAWTALPRLRLAGDAAADLAAGYATVTGKVNDAKLVRGNLGGSLAKNAQPLELELREA